MTRKEMLRQLEKLRAEIEKDDPSLADVMAELEALKDEVARLRAQHPIVIKERVYGPYRPYYPTYPFSNPVWYGSNSGGIMSAGSRQSVLPAYNGNSTITSSSLVTGG